MSCWKGSAPWNTAGYDSAGVSVFTENGLQTVKSAGRLAVVAERLGIPSSAGCCGIGHTRWATHGEPSDANAHPHGTARLSLVHNGIIENYAELKMELSAQGYTFETQTDTEVAAKLLDSCYQGDPIEAIRTACAKMEGSYAFGILFADRPGEVYGTRLNSPLLAAVGEGEGFLASDISAVLQYTKQYYTLEHGEIVTISPDGAISFCTMDGEPGAEGDAHCPMERGAGSEKTATSILCAKKFSNSPLRFTTPFIPALQKVCRILPMTELLQAFSGMLPASRWLLAVPPVMRDL